MNVIEFRPEVKSLEDKKVIVHTYCAEINDWEREKLQGSVFKSR